MLCWVTLSLTQPTNLRAVTRRELIKFAMLRTLAIAAIQAGHTTIHQHNGFGFAFAA
jgi:hypothetical protein